MIKTTTPIPYDIFDETKIAVVYKKVFESKRIDDAEIYEILTSEWVEIDERIVYLRPLFIRTITFAQMDALQLLVDAEYDLSGYYGSAQRKRYSELGLLIQTNLDNLLSATWEEV